jgi:hypothetical protein
VDFEDETIKPGLGILQDPSGSLLADDPLGEGRLDPFLDYCQERVDQFCAGLPVLLG